MSDHKTRKEKRRHTRIPVRVPLKVTLDGEERSIEFKTNIIDYSHGGICIEWGLCKQCTGYTFGIIDEQCIFAPYSSASENTEPVDFFIDNAETGEEEHFSGKAVYTSKTEQVEKIGIQFIDMPDGVRPLICP